METVTYFLATQRSSGAVTFRIDNDSRAEFLIQSETCPYFRTAFKRFTRSDAIVQWRQKGYHFERMPDG